MCVRNSQARCCFSDNSYHRFIPEGGEEEENNLLVVVVQSCSCSHTVVLFRKQIQSEDQNFVVKYFKIYRCCCSLCFISEQRERKLLSIDLFRRFEVGYIRLMSFDFLLSTDSIAFSFYQKISQDQTYIHTYKRNLVQSCRMTNCKKPILLDQSVLPYIYTVCIHIYIFKQFIPSLLPVSLNGLFKFIILFSLI